MLDSKNRKEKIKNWFRQNKANLVTTVGLIFAFILLSQVSFSPKNLAPILIVYSFAQLSDFVDGKIARKNKIESNFGAVIDPFRDKIIFLSKTILIIQHANKFHFSVFGFLFVIFFFESLTVFMAAIGIFWHIKGIKIVEISSSASGKKKTFCGFIVGLCIIFFLMFNEIVWVKIPALALVYIGFSLIVFWELKSVGEYEKKIKNTQ